MDNGPKFWGTHLIEGENALKALEILSGRCVATKQSIAVNPNAKAALLAELDCLVSQYLARGGKITKCQTGKRELPATLPFSYFINSNTRHAKAAGLLPWGFPDFVGGGGGDPHYDTREWGEDEWLS
jgi:hypothetical protein